MKTVEVVAAVIKHEDKIFATQRGYGDLAGGWEFPGGKVEAGEMPQEALVREIHEELEATISVGEFICQVEYDYPTFHLSMKCCLCSVVEGHLTLLEHSDARWLEADALDSVDWLPADVAVVDAIKEQGILE